MFTRSVAHRGAPVVAFLRALPARLVVYATVSRSRRDLLRLDAHLLRDIGLTEEDAVVEARRPVWDAPSHWKA